MANPAFEEARRRFLASMLPYNHVTVKFAPGDPLTIGDALGLDFVGPYLDGVVPEDVLERQGQEQG